MNKTMIDDVCSFVLRKGFGGNERVIEEGYFSSIRDAHSGLVGAMVIEENLDKVLSNYIELEKCLFAFSLDHMHGRGGLDTRGDTWRSECDRHIANVLSSSRTYLDHASAILTNYDKEGHAKSAFKSLCSQHYDANPSYQLCECLRNISQHSSNVVHGIMISSRTITVQGVCCDEYAVYPFLSQAILGTSKIKASVRAVLGTMGKMVDLRPHLRSYVCSLERIHFGVRNLISQNVGGWDAIMIGILEEFGESGDYGYVEALRQDQDGNVIDRVPVLSRMTRHRKSLTQKNNLEYSWEHRLVTNGFFVGDSHSVDNG